MEQALLERYAKLLVEYSLYLKEGESLYINTTTEAIPLVREIYRLASRKQVLVECNFDFEGKNRIFFEEAESGLLNMEPRLHRTGIGTFDAYLYIKAPFSSSGGSSIDPNKQAIRSKAMQPLSQLYFDRMASGSMKRSLCLYPTASSAALAEMSMNAYIDFVAKACKLDQSDPKAAWEQLSKNQQHIVDYLNGKQHVRYKNKRSDIAFSIEGRTWMNSDGKTNMPSGEVYSSPVEDSVQGEIYFDYPSYYMGKVVSGVTLQVKDGRVVHATAEKGQEHVDALLEMDGARYFGEVAIGTNYEIQRTTKNILFDEKIGGSIHMALGQSYGQTGGKNQSSIHWDMICNMKDGGQIFVDDVLIYENGQFLI